MLVKKIWPSIFFNILAIGFYFEFREMRLIATKNVAFVEYGDEYQSTVAMSGNKSDYSIIRKTVTWIRVFFKNFICKEMINTRKIYKFNYFLFNQLIKNFL